MAIMKVLSSLAVLAAIPLSNAKQITTYLIEEESAITCDNAIGSTVCAVGSFTSFEAVPPWVGWESTWTSDCDGSASITTENEPGRLVFGGCDNGGLCSVSIDSDVCTCHTPIDTQNACTKVPDGPTPVPAPSAPTQPSTWKTYTIEASSTVSCADLYGAKVCAVGSFSSVGAPAGWVESTTSDCEGKFYFGNALSPPSLSFGACLSSGSCTVSFDRRYCECQGGCSEVSQIPAPAPASSSPPGRDETIGMYRIIEESDVTCYSGGALVCAVGPYTRVDMPSGWTESFISDCEGTAYVTTADSVSSLSFGGCDTDGSCIVSLDTQLCECRNPADQQVVCLEILRTNITVPQPQPTSSPSLLRKPTSSPSLQPQPTSSPLSQPQPTSSPSSQPQPTSLPSSQPQPTSSPSSQPQPTSSPSSQPSLMLVPTTSPPTTSGAESRGVPQAVVALLVGLLIVMAGSC